MMNIIASYILIAIFKYISAIPGIVETIAGGGSPHQGKKGTCNDVENSKDGIGVDARFNYPWGIAFDHFQNAVYVADCGCPDSDHRTDKIRRIDLKTEEVITIAGSTQGFADGFGPYAHFKHIAGITIDPELEMLYIADSGNHRIRLIYLANNKVTTIAGLPIAGFVDQSTISSQFNNPQSIALHRTGDGKRILYVADTDNHAIRVIHLNTDDTGYVTTLAGGTKGFKDGVKLQAKFYHPSDIVIDGVGKYMYIADHFNHAIRRLEISTGIVTTLAGKGFGAEIGLDKKTKHVVFHYPEGLVYDPDYHLLYVCEFDNHDILVVTMEGFVKTLAGQKKGKKDAVGRVARFYHPSGLSFDRKNRMLFVSDQYNHLVRSVSAFGSKKKYDPTSKKKRKRKVKLNPVKTSNPFLNIHMYFGIVLLLAIGLAVKPCCRFCFKLNGNLANSPIRQTTL